jgi:single-stranded DNA-specific DHH superfamily exonuclease
MLASENKLLFFQYAGDLSISADLANELCYLFPKKIIIVVYVSGIKGNISGRGEKVKGIVLKAIEGIEGATGGGHENAVGAQVKIEDLERFRENIEKLI